MRTFRADHEESRLERLAGRPVVFPHGTYGMRVFHGVEVAEPRSDAIVAQPGPLLHEVLRDLEAGAREAGAHVQVLEEVRAAWAEEADEVVATDELDFACAAPTKPKSPSSTKTTDSKPVEELEQPPRQDATKERARREAEVRHRFDRESDGGEDHARRLIIERDRRRGRPPEKPGGSDPPS